jgi:hypothetical protein
MREHHFHDISQIITDKMAGTDHDHETGPRHGDCLVKFEGNMAEPEA